MQEFIVSNLEDENDGDFSDGDLSLREAIANSNNGDKITFAEDLSGSTINLSQGELVIDKNLAIEGLGADRLTINAQRPGRVFKIDDGDADNEIDVTLDGLTITGGSLRSRSGVTFFKGAGIFTTENLELINSKVSGNIARDVGGGIYSSGGRLRIDNSTIEDNLAGGDRGIGGSYGGGIAAVGTTVEITNSSIDDNTAELDGGGGLDLRDSQVTITDSSISGNSAFGRSGINSLNSNVSITRSVISGNETRTSSVEGSGTINSDANSVLTIDRSIIDSNFGVPPSFPSDPTVIQTFTLGISAAGTTNITNSTISNSTVEVNSVVADNPALEQLIGFGLKNTGELNVVNSTFAGNEDGGITNEGGTVNISNTTIADGLDNVDLSNVTSTIVTVVDDGRGAVGIDDNQNLIGNLEDLGLGELQDNGGTTPTIALLANSPAIDAGTNPNNLATDQRGEGFDRTVGNGTDIGAFELQETNMEVTTDLIVSTLEDENDGDFSDGDLSLREAIANSNSGDTINFSEDLSGGTIVLSQGELLIDKSLTINGLGADRLTIDTNSNDPNGNKRVFNLNDGTDAKIEVVINGLKITGGNSLDGPINIFGGGILNQENLELNNSEVVDNAGNSGAGIYNLDAIASINNSRIANNLIAANAPVSAGTVGLGGGIANLRSTVEINNSVISDNSSTGINAEESTLTITNSEIANNSGLGTGGIRSVNSTVNLENSLVSNNSASALGLSGGITSIQGSTLNIDNSTISDNFGSGGGAGDPQGRSTDSSGILADGLTFISNSTISGNRGIGFGIKNRGRLNVINSTFADNEGTAVVNQSSGISFIGNSTIANNAVSNVGGIQTGGIFNDTRGEVALLSTIVANNGDGSTPDIANNGQISGVANLVGNGDNLPELSDSDLTGTTDNPIDPGLGTLQNNGGNTPTIALAADSPAIDRGGDPASDNLPFDQRGEGFDRVVGDNIDIGAFELQEINMEISTDLIVSTFEDENDGDFSDGDLSLREAIANAESGDTISFSSNLSGTTINLSLGELLIDKNLTINGLGSDRLTIDAGNNSRIFNIDDGNEENFIEVAIDGLAIKNGNADQDTSSNNNGGGILNSENLEVSNADIYNNQAILEGGGIYSNGTLTVNNSEIYSNSVGDGRDRTTAGGGIYSDGTLTVNNSAIYSNSGSGNFGIATGGGITNAGTATINQSTISNNSVGGRLNTAGGIDHREGDLTITNSTISNNSSNLTGGILNSGGEVTVTSTIIANVGNQNINGNDFVSGGNNFISGEAIVGSRGGPVTISAEGFTDGENGDIVGTLENSIDPLLGELQDNGGATPTIALLENSPAIDAGSNPNDLATDQRGEGFDRTVGAGTDIGAFEVQDNSETPTTPETPDTLVVSTLDDENDGDFSDGDLSLREAIANANSGDTITFSSNLSGGTINLTLGDLVVDRSLNIQGLGANALTIDAGRDAGNSNVRVFKIDDGDDSTQVDVNLSGLTITGGDAGQFFGSNAANIENADGGGIFNAENLTLDRSRVTDNFALADGGGIFNTGRLKVTNGSIDNNSVAQSSISVSTDGGGIFNQGFAEISNSTITNNAGTQGGGIFNDRNVFNSETQTVSETLLNVTNSTISNNSGSDVQGSPIIGAGAGIFNREGSVTISSNIIANNETDLVVSSNNDVPAEIISDGNNLIGNVGNYAGFTDSDLVGTSDNSLDPLLGELQDNGGSTPTRALLDDSPAIDAGNNLNNLITDQRGEGFDRTVGNGTDIGAFEVQDGSVRVPDVERPDIEVPDIQRPDVQRPDIQVPDIQVPDIEVPSNFLEGTDGDDSLSGNGTNDDVITGGAGHDTLDGNGGNDNISGDAGDDLILGGAGDDLLDGRDGHNEISGENGHDTLFGGEGNDTLTGGAGDDLIVGAGGHDSLLGSNGHDVINGEAGDDFINGDRGDDLITGGAGADTLIGGAGHDVFVLEASDVHDTIVDFELGSDRLQLDDSLTLGQLSIVDNEANTGSLILDTNNHDAVIAAVENVHAADLEIHLIC